MVPQTIKPPRRRVGQEHHHVGRARGTVIHGHDAEAWSEYWEQRIVAQKQQLREAAQRCHRWGIQLVVIVNDEDPQVTHVAITHTHTHTHTDCVPRTYLVLTHSQYHAIACEYLFCHHLGNTSLFVYCFKIRKKLLYKVSWYFFCVCCRDLYGDGFVVSGLSVGI